ncbi:hypothetical protein BaRGS_00013634, partial [Batillaria attramentaria]
MEVVFPVVVKTLVEGVLWSGTAKEYYNSPGGHQPTANGGVPGMKPHTQHPQQQSYDNPGMDLHDTLDPGGAAAGSSSLPLSPSRLPDGRQNAYPGSEPPSYWNLNAHHYGNRNDTSFDSQQERQMFENELNRRNDMMLYGRADGYRGQETITMHGRPQSPTKGKYIDLDDRKDPSLQSQESGYSTGDPNKPKKTFNFSWRPPRPFSARRRILSRMRKKQKSQPHPRFSHSPPGHTCGLPCCSDNIHIHVKPPAPRYGCMPVPYKQADLENNFTFRRNQLITGRPSLSSKFFSLQTPGGAKGRARSQLPRFHDDHGIEDGRTDDEDDPEASTSAASENLHKYKASIETDTDAAAGNPQPYLDRIDYDRTSVIRVPVRHLRPWECFHKREIILPDLPSTRVVWCFWTTGLARATMTRALGE